MSTTFLRDDTEGESWFVITHKNSHYLYEFLRKAYPGIELPTKPFDNCCISLRVYQVPEWGDKWLIDHCYVKNRCKKCRQAPTCYHYKKGKEYLCK